MVRLKKKDRLKNKVIEASTSNNESAPQIVVPALKKMDEVQGNETVELVSITNTNPNGEKDINRKTEIVVVDEVQGSEIVVSITNRNGQEEINRNADVQGKPESRGHDKCVGELGDRKMEGASNGKRSGDELVNRNVEIMNLVEKNDGGGVGGVNQKRGEGGVEVSRVTRKNKKRRLREAEEAERKRRCVLNVEGEMKGEVNEKREVGVIDKMDVDASERDLVQKEQDGGGCQVLVQVADQKKDVQGSDVKEIKLPVRKKFRLRKAKKARLLEEAKKNNHEAEIADKEGESAYVEKLDGDYVSERAEAESGNVKKKQEIVVEMQVGEASGKDDVRGDQEKEMKRNQNEKHYAEVNDRMDVDAVQGRDLVQKDEQDGEGVPMSVQVTNQKGVVAATEVNKMKFSRGQMNSQRISQQVALRSMEEANQNKQDCAAILEHGGQEVDLKQEGVGAVLERPTGGKTIKGNQSRQFPQKGMARHKQLEEQACSQIDEDSRAKIIAVLNQFRVSEDRGE